MRFLLTEEAYTSNCVFLLRLWERVFHDLQKNCPSLGIHSLIYIVSNSFRAKMENMTWINIKRLHI